MLNSFSIYCFPSQRRGSLEKKILYQFQKLDHIEAAFPLAVRHFVKLLPLTVLENVVQFENRYSVAQEPM